MDGFHQHLRGNDLGDDPNTEITRWTRGAAGDSILQSWQCPAEPTCDSVHSQNCLCGTRNNKIEHKCGKTRTSEEKIIRDRLLIMAEKWRDEDG